MKKEIIIDRFTGNKSVVYSDFTEEELKRLRDKAEEKIRKKNNVKRVMAEYLKR